MSTKLTVTGATAFSALSALAKNPNAKVVIPGVHSAGGEQESLLICLDRSPSMMEIQPDGIQRMKAARDAAMRLIQASTYSQVGLASFSEHFQLHAEIGDRERAQQMLGTIEFSSYTFIIEALKGSYQILRLQKTPVKRLILLSDGEANDMEWTDEQRFKHACDLSRAAKTAENIITDTIAFGEGADFTMLEGIAKAGGGRVIRADSADELIRGMMQLEARTRGLLTGRK